VVVEAAMSAPPSDRGQRTYSHLAGARRRPSDYEIASSRLLYYVERGFELPLPIGEWYRTHQQGSPLGCDDWERFADPRETTYASYTELQRTKEAFVDGLLEAAADRGHDRRLSPAWLGELDRALPALRFPVHGLQMIAAYVGSMAPSGRIVIACAFQAADEVRRVQRVAYRMRQLMDVAPGFGQASAAAWQDEPAWQPLRRLIERLLCTYDWGEALIALALAVKPRLDHLIVAELAGRARAAGDDVLDHLLFSLDEDCRWHRAWSAALIRTALADRASNRAVIDGWLDRWRPLAIAAIEALAARFEARPGAVARVEAAFDAQRAAAGLA
jgi:toluene monooxygenase system protein E